MGATVIACAHTDCGRAVAAAEPPEVRAAVEAGKIRVMVRAVSANRGLIWPARAETRAACAQRA